MIRQLYVIMTPSVDPYHNLALEKALFASRSGDSMILYLWQNEKTVVIGKNQNAYNECNLDTLHRDGGHLARRLSGGGAVYHDLGNLNFTFLSPKENFNEEKENEVILNALRHFGLPAYQNGRNDLLIDGRKFSGHAFQHSRNTSLHHGTIMLHVNAEALSRYLNVSLLKLKDKHVASVRSRVINLNDILPDLTVDACKEALIRSAEEIYGLKAQTLTEEDLDPTQLEADIRLFSDKTFLYGREDHLSHGLEERFVWGTVRIEYEKENDILTDVAVYSDALNTEHLSSLPDLLRGKTIQEIKEVLLSSDQPEMDRDIWHLLERGSSHAI